MAASYWAATPIGSGAGQSIPASFSGSARARSAACPTRSARPSKSAERRALTLENPAEALLSGSRTVHRRGNADVSRTEALGPAPRGGRPQPQRQLHAVALYDGHRRLAVSRVHEWLHGSEQPLPSIAATAARTGAHRDGDRGRVRRVRQRGAAHGGLGLACVGHSQRAIRATGLTITTTGMPPRRASAASDESDPSTNAYGDKTLNNYLNVAAFAAPTPGTFGKHKEGAASRALGTGPSDLALSRTRRARCAGAPARGLSTCSNNFNWGNPSTSINSSTFGRIQTQTGDSRILQFGIKYRVLEGSP